MTVMMMMTRWTMLLRGLVITCVSAFVSGWMHSWGKVVIKSTNISSPILPSEAQIYHRQYCHQKHKYITANIVIKSTNISSPILSVLLNGKPASNCMNLVPAVQHINGSQLFKLNQKLALIMNLLTLWSEDRETLWNWQTFIFFQIQDMAHQCDWISTYFTP